MAEQRVFILHGDLAPVQKVDYFVFEGPEFEVVELSPKDLGEGDPGTGWELMRRVDEWAEQRQDGSRAYPTFRTTGTGYTRKYEAVRLSKVVCQRHDSTMGELWHRAFNPNFDVGHLFRVSNDHCQKSGFATGFPNGWFGGGGYPDEKIQIVAIRPGYVRRLRPDLPELGQLSEEDLAGRIQACHTWAVEQGFVSGLPSFHMRDWNRPWGERSGLTRAEQELNDLMRNDGWRVVRVDPMKLSESQAGLVYLLERDQGP